MWGPPRAEGPIQPAGPLERCPLCPLGVRLGRALCAATSIGNLGTLVDLPGLRCSQSSNQTQAICWSKQRPVGCPPQPLVKRAVQTRVQGTSHSCVITATPAQAWTPLQAGSGLGCFPNELPGDAVQGALRSPELWTAVSTVLRPLWECLSTSPSLRVARSGRRAQAGIGNRARGCLCESIGTFSWNGPWAAHLREG